MTQPSDVSILAVGPDTIALPTRDEIRQQQETDPLLHDVLDFLKHPQTRQASPEVKQVLRDTGTISIDSSTGLLMHTTVVNGRRCHVPILPPATRLVAMKALHGLPIAGHLGYKKTYHRIRSQFYWKGMAQDIKAFVQSCLSCQSRKPPSPCHSGHLQLFSASRPFEAVGVDIFCLLPRTTHGNRYVVVMPKTNRMSLVSDMMMPLTVSFILTKVDWFFCIYLPVNQVVCLSSHRVIRGPTESFADCPTFCTKFLTWKPVLSFVLQSCTRLSLQYCIDTVKCPASRLPLEGERSARDISHLDKATTLYPPIRVPFNICVAIGSLLM